MVEGPPIALRCRNTRGRTLAVSRQQARQADDHPPVEPPVSPSGRGGRDQEGRDAARVATACRTHTRILRESRFAMDSPLEGSGFELPVPRCALIANSAALVAPPDSAVRGGSLNGRLQPRS